MVDAKINEIYFKANQLRSSDSDSSDSDGNNSVIVDSDREVMKKRVLEILREEYGIKIIPEE